MVHVHWGTYTGGARNCRAGEYDTCEFFTIITGVPVYFSFRGCFHVVERSRVKSGERRERLREFARTFLGLPDLPRQMAFPLRPLRSLQWMWFYYFFLWLLGAASIPGVSLALLTLLPNPLPNGQNNIVLVIFWSIDGAFLLCLAPYLLLRRPSRRQARIRGVVASRLGPFSDPSDWPSELVARVAAAFGIVALTSEELIRTAERLLKREHVEDALVVARMALALAGPSPGLNLAGRAEDITEECFRLLDRGGW
jgi:hypothetical protein